jgi:hypothetical protein
LESKENYDAYSPGENDELMASLIIDFSCDQQCQATGSRDRDTHVHSCGRLCYQNKVQQKVGGGKLTFMVLEFVGISS